MRGLHEPEEKEDFWLCPVRALAGRPKRVGHDCLCGIARDVHDMEIQFWEALTPDEIPRPPTLENMYAVLAQRFAQRSPRGAVPEGMPFTMEQVDVKCVRRVRTGRIKFTTKEVMGTAVSESQEHFRVKHNRGYAESGVTGKYAVGLLTQIFKARIPDWHMILEARASRDVMNVIEIGTLAKWEPEQDLSQDSREVITPARIVEARGRGTVIRNEWDLQRLLGQQVAIQREIKIGVGLWENGRMTDMWFCIQTQAAQTIEEYGA
jgi:hypothetical protein